MFEYVALITFSTLLLIFFFRFIVRFLGKMAGNNPSLNRLEQRASEADHVIEYLKQQVALLKEKASKKFGLANKSLPFFRYILSSFFFCRHKPIACILFYFLKICLLSFIIACILLYAS